MHFVIDNSVVMRWLFGDGVAADVKYAEDVLTMLQQNDIRDAWRRHFGG